MQQSQVPPPLARAPPRLGHGFHEKHTEIRFSFAPLFLGVRTTFQALPKWFPSLHSCLCPDLGQVQKTTLVPPCLSHLCAGVLRLLPPPFRPRLAPTTGEAPEGTAFRLSCMD